MGQFLKISPFFGMFPRVAERLLPDGSAVEAFNLVMSSGEIRPVKQPQFVFLPSISGPWFAVYRPEWNGAQRWLAWNKDVDVSRAPLSVDVEPRYYWTGDNEPRFSTFNNLPATFFALGVPKPVKAPTVSHAGGTGSAVSRVYVYTFFTVLGEESGSSPANVIVAGRVDGAWSISGMDAFPANSGSGTASHSAGVTTFTNSGNHWLRAGDEITISSAKVVVISTPSPSTFTVQGNYSAATSWGRAAPWNTTGMKRRLYRSAGTNATYQLVNDNVGTSHSDTLTDTQIMGDTLISSNWLPPPTNLRGIIALPSGAMAGFAGNQLCYSEPFQPHAWPLAYRFGADHEIVAIESFGNTVVAATAGKPYVSSGVEPSSSSMDSVDQVWPCLSKRSIVSVGDGVMYATSNGMAYVGAAGASIWTDPFFTKVEWQPKDPSSMVASMSEGKVFIRWVGTDGTKGVMVFDPKTQNSGMSLLSDVPDEIYTDPRNGKLYFVDSRGILLYDMLTGARLPYSWRSKEYYLSQPVNFGIAKVDYVSEQSVADYDAELAAYNADVAANVSNVTGYYGFGGINRSSINALLLNGSTISNIQKPDLSSVTFSLFADGQLVHSRNLISGEKFRLPGGYKASTVQIQLNGTVRVKAVRLAETPSVMKSMP
jgi:hypothetical protein